MSESVEILVVDDRPENLRALRAILEEPGHVIVEATSGEAALREVLRHDFTVILLDAYLPGMDGFEVAQLIKQRERTREVPILFLTAAGVDKETLERAYAVGAADYLVKPVSAAIVRAKVAVFVELARKSAQLRRQAELLQDAERRQQAIELAELKLQSERRYRHLAEAIPQIVWRALPDGAPEYWNHRWYDYTGAAEGLSPEGGWEFIHPDDRERCRSAWRAAVSKGEQFQCEFRILGRGGAYRWHLRRALPEKARDGQIIAWLGTDTDIDDMRRAEDERAELLVRERAARFEAEAAQKRAAQLYIEAREAVRLRDDFLTVAAHELRTPLTALRLQAQHAARREEAPGPARNILRSVERLCFLADQLLDVTRIASGNLTLRLEHSDLRVIAEQVAARLSEEAARNGCSIEVAPGAAVQMECDPLRIEQVIGHLVGNAIKYGRGKPIEVVVTRNSHEARLSVHDHGIGVPEGQQARIFERYARAVSVRSYGGLGLGLFLSRQIVQAHGGTIEVHSEPGAGATFSLELPLEQASHSQAQLQ